MKPEKAREWEGWCVYGPANIPCGSFDRTRRGAINLHLYLHNDPDDPRRTSWATFYRWGFRCRRITIAPEKQEDSRG